MYEMYPDTWPTAQETQPAATEARPRRRARKEHSVLPAVLVHQAQPVRSERPA